MDYKNTTILLDIWPDGYWDVYIDGKRAMSPSAFRIDLSSQPQRHTLPEYTLTTMTMLPLFDADNSAEIILHHKDPENNTETTERR